MEKLRNQRSDRAAGHDNRPFGAERAARTDCDRRRQRLEEGDLRLDAAPVDQDGLDGFRDAMPADALRAVPRHDADDERAGDWNEDHEWSQRVRRRSDRRHAQALVEEHVGEKADERQEGQCDPGADDADHDREGPDRQEARRRREVGELLGDVARLRCRAHHVLSPI